MANAEIVINQKGPLPISTTFQAKSDGPALLMLSGSVWAVAAQSLIGFQLLVDDVSIAAATIFANLANSHMAVVPIAVPYTFTFGQHKITLTPMTGPTVSDQNDSFQVTVLY